jgi:hypothetical protein
MALTGDEDDLLQVTRALVSIGTRFATRVCGADGIDQVMRFAIEEFAALQASTSTRP